ncbi:unnamed protein product [Hanseniaspora opuntiae]
MGYLDTLKKLNKPAQKKIVSTKPSSSYDEEDDRMRLLKIAKSQIDPLDIKTNLLPEDYKPVIPRHIIERNLERKTKQLKKMNSKLKNSGNSTMHQDELAEGNKKHEAKPIEKKVIKETENKIDKKSRFLNREKINEQKRLEAFKNQEKLLSKAKPREPKKHDISDKGEEKEDEYEYTPTGFDLLMEEELEAEEIARREDIKEAKLLKKRALEKQKLKNRH